MGKLYVLNGEKAGEFFELREGVTFVGRSSENDIQIQDRTVSRRHLRILKNGEKYLIADLESRIRRKGPVALAAETFPCSWT